MDELTPIPGSSPEQTPKPTGAEREAYILREINDNGQSRDQVASLLGINDDALYMFMRRKGYSWCGNTKKFNKKPNATPAALPGDKVPQAANTSQEQSRPATTPAQNIAASTGSPAPEDNSRQAKVVRLIASGTDCETAAITEGFADRHEMGKFMADNGYRWSCEAGNYIAAGNGTAGPEPSITVPPETSPDKDRVPFEPDLPEPSAANYSADDFALFSDHGFEPLAIPESALGVSEKPDANNDERREEIMEKENITPADPFTLTEQQAHILDYLNTNFVKLAAVINGFDNTVAADIPRYAISDARRSKLFMFSEELAEALKDFSVRHEIDQRDLVESAIIDFMLRYGGDQTTNMSFRRLLCA